MKIFFPIENRSQFNDILIAWSLRTIRGLIKAIFNGEFVNYDGFFFPPLVLISLASGYIAAMLNGCEQNECVCVGLNAAVQSLLSLQTVPDNLRYETIKTPVSSIELPITGITRCILQPYLSRNIRIKVKDEGMLAARYFVTLFLLLETRF